MLLPAVQLRDRAELIDALNGMAPAGCPVSGEEFDTAFAAALYAQRGFEQAVESAAERAFDWARSDPARPRTERTGCV